MKVQRDNPIEEDSKMKFEIMNRNIQINIMINYMNKNFPNAWSFIVSFMKIDGGDYGFLLRT